MADIERIAGNAQAEADRLRVHCDDLRVRGVTAALSYDAPLLGRALCALGEFDDVERLAAEGREYGAETDPVTQALWRQVTGLVQAHRGNHADAERFAREAVEYTLRTDSPWTAGRCALRSRDGSRSRRAPRGCPRHLAGSTRSLRAQADHPARPPHPRTTRGAGSSEALSHKPPRLPVWGAQPATHRIPDAAELTRCARRPLDNSVRRRTVPVLRRETTLQREAP